MTLLRLFAAFGVVAVGLTPAAAVARCPDHITSPSWSAGGSDDDSSAGGLRLDVDGATGCFTIAVDGVMWLASDHLLLSAAGTLHTSPAGGTSSSGGGGSSSSTSTSGTAAAAAAVLVPHATSEFHGEDALGAFAALAVTWTSKTQAKNTSSIVHGGSGGSDSVASSSKWTGAWTTTWRHYNGSRQVVFKSTYSGAVTNGQRGPATESLRLPPAWGTPQSVFPSFSGHAGRASTLGALTFHNQGTPTATVGLANLGKVATMGFAGGVPVVLVDNTTRTTIVISPMSEFLSTTFNMSSSGSLLCGVQGAATAIPDGHSTEVLLQLGNGLSDTVLEWGSKLLHMYNKAPIAADHNVHVERLGYSTVGHYFYGLIRGKTAEETLALVSADAAAKGLPYSWYLIDSWWYGENSTPEPGTFGGTNLSVPGFGGTWRWDDSIARSRKGNFPSGLKNLTARLGAPLVMHMGEWVGNSTDHPDCGNPPCSGSGGAPPYSDPTSGYPDSEGWIIGKSASLPLGADGGRAFWDRIFRDAADWGLAVFKLDHAQSNIPNLPEAQTDLYATATWLSTMTEAAAKHGISKQFGGTVSSMFLHSVTLASVCSARVGPDYIPSAHRAPGTCAKATDDAAWSDLSRTEHARSTVGSAEGSATLGRNSLVPWALGIRPYKDATFTGPQRWSKTTCLQRLGASYTMPEWYGLQDPYPELGVVVSAMAAGPIASCDGLGDTNASLLMRVARADGVLLKPNRPAIAIDNLWMGDIFKSGSLQSKSGEVSATFTSLGSSSPTLYWHFVLGWGLDNAAETSGGGYGVQCHDLVGCKEPLKAAPQCRPSTGCKPLAPYLAWPEYLDGRSHFQQLRAFPAKNTTLPILKAKGVDYGQFTFWRTAPLLCAATDVPMALLGEIAKFISISSQRITRFSAECSSNVRGQTRTAWNRINLDLTGAPGEVVSMVYWKAALKRDEDMPHANCALGPNGKATLMITVFSDSTKQDHVVCSPSG